MKQQPTPPPTQKEQFIVLDQLNSTYQSDNCAIYEVQLANPTVLPALSQVTISDAYIDTGLPSQGGFDIGQDIDVTMHFAYSMRLFDATTHTLNPHMELCFLHGAHTLKVKTKSFTIPAGTYSPEGLAKFITDSTVRISRQFHGVQDLDNFTWYQGGRLSPHKGDAIFFPTDPMAGDVLSKSSGDNAQMLANPPISENPYAPGLNMGTNQFALEYNPDGTGRYSFTFLHRPCLSDTGQPCIFLQKDAGGYFFAITSVSNLILYNLEPASLWSDMLGFDLNQMCLINRLDGNANFNLESYLACTTRAYVGVDAYNLSSTSVPPGLNSCVSETNWPHDADHPVTILTPQVEYVTASRPPAFNSIGYYLIDLQLCPPSSNTLADQENLNASALVNKTFTSEEGFAFSVSSIVQTLTTPLLISSAKVTILNATTRLPATGLGSRNSIIIKAVY